MPRRSGPSRTLSITSRSAPTSSASFSSPMATATDLADRLGRVANILSGDDDLLARSMLRRRAQQVDPASRAILGANRNVASHPAQHASVELELQTRRRIENHDVAAGDGKAREVRRQLAQLARRRGRVLHESDVTAAAFLVSVVTHPDVPTRASAVP